MGQPIAWKHEKQWVLIVSSRFAISHRGLATNLCSSRIVKLEIREALVCLLALWERIEVRESVAEISPAEVKVENAKRDNALIERSRA